MIPLVHFCFACALLVLCTNRQSLCYSDATCQSQLYYQSSSLCVQTERSKCCFPQSRIDKLMYIEYTNMKIKICVQICMYIHSQRHIFTCAHINT